VVIIVINISATLTQMVSPVQSEPEGTVWLMTVQTGSLREPETDPLVVAQQPQKNHPVTSRKMKYKYNTNSN